jgi:hypothetical protein
MKYFYVVLIIAALVSIRCAEDLEAPTVSIVSPQHGATVSGIVDVTAAAQDNEAVEKVEFYFNDTLTAVVLIEPYIYQWNTAQEEDSSFHTIHARAYDASDNEGVSGSVTVLVDY